MIALYKEINDRQLRDLEEALKHRPAKLDDVARVMSQSATKPLAPSGMRSAPP